MFTRVQVTGATEKAALLKAFAEELPDVIVAGVKEIQQDVSQALKNEPPPPPGSRYVRTDNYINTQVETPIQSSGQQVLGAVETPISYAIYLRGDGNYPGAWMHVGRFESIAAIVERLTPGAVVTMENRIDGLEMRLGL